MTFTSLHLLSALVPYGTDGLQTLAENGPTGDAARQGFITENQGFLPGCSPELVQRAAKAALKTAIPLVEGTTSVFGPKGEN